MFDRDGELLTPRPDVTLQVARLAQAHYEDSDLPLKFRYNQRVFREQERGRGDVREFTQIGVEAFGESGRQADYELVQALLSSLGAAGLADCRVLLCTVDVLAAVLAWADGGPDFDVAVKAALHANDFVHLEELLAAADLEEEKRRVIWELPRIHGGDQALAKAQELLRGIYDWKLFAALWQQLKGSQGMLELDIDFSVMSSFDYYTGLVFEAYAPGHPGIIASGGRYDHMLAWPAAGFALYLENITEALNADD
jgi:ATP phosphoribosyltransferase regulatory subunit